MTFLLGCGKRDFLTKCTAFFLPVHGQGVVDRLIVVRHPHVIAGHEELEFDLRAGVGDGIRIICQTFDLPDDVIAFLLVNAKGNRSAHFALLTFLSIPVVAILRLGLLGHNIGAYLINSVIILGVGVSNVVLTRRHLDVHIVAAGGGGNRLALVGAVQQSHLRVGIVIIFAFVFHRVLGGIIVKVLNYGRVADSVLTHNNRTGLVFFAFLCNDGSLIAAKLVRIRYLVDKGHAFVYTGNALELKCALANAFWAGQREGAIPIRVGLKVLQFKALKGQLSGYGVSIRQLFNDAVVVIVILHIKPDVVGACLGGHFFRSGQPIICSAVLKGSLRNRIAEILRAVVACSTVLEVKAEVRACRPILPCTLTDQKFTALVQRALFGTDVHLIAAVLGFGREVVELLVVVGTHIDEAQLTHALLIAGNDRVLRSPANRKVALLQGREGQLSAGSHVHYNGLAVILGGQGQGLAICGKLCVRIISADSLAVDIRDRLAEGDRHRSIADKVNRVCCYGIAVDSIHSAVCDHQLALLLTGGEVFAFNIAAAYRIGNSDLAVITRQAAKDHGILDDRFLRGIVRQLDIVEHAAGDLAVLVQLNLSVECAASDLAISADDILESAACDGAVFIHVDILLEGAVLNDGVLRTNRALCHDAGDSHICKSDLLHGNGLMVGVAGNRRKIHRVAVRGGDVERRACPSVLFHGGVLPAQTLIEVSRHALAAHRHTGHAGQVGQTLFGNAQGLEVAWIGGLIHKDFCAVIVASNAQHLAVGRGVGVVAADRCIVDAQHIGVQGKLCAACAHQIDGIGGKRQSSAVHRSHTAVAHHQCAEPLSCGQQLLDAVRQLAQNRIRNGVGVIAIGIEIAALDHRIGNRARAIAEQGIKGAAGDLDRTVPIDRVDAHADIVEAAAADLTAGDRQSAVFAKLTAGNIGIGDLDRAVDRHIAQRAEVEVRAALIQDLQSAFIAAVVGVAVITPAVAHVNTVQLCVRVQTVHIGHVGQVGLTFTVKVQLCIAKHHRNQLHGGIVRKRKRTEAGRERFAVCTDGDRGNCHAAVCKTVVSGACGQSHDTAVGRGYRPRIAAGIAFHHQLQIVPVTGIAILLDEIDIPGFLPAVQGAVLRQDQLACLPLRVGAQAGDIAEKAAPDIAAVLGQLIVGAAVNGAQIQLHIGVAAAQNVDAVHIVGFYQKCAGDSAVQQINRVTISILDGHIAADRAAQNVLGIFTAGTGDGQSGSFVKAPAGTGCCLGQTVRTDLDLDHLIFCFRVRTNILILVLRAISDAVGLFRRYGRRPRPCICKCGYREDGEHHTERQYHAHDAFFHDILSFVG